MKTYLAVVLVAFAASSAPAAAQMAGAEIQKAFVGKQIALSCVDGTVGSGTYRMTGGRGTISGTYTKNGMARMKDTGVVRAQCDNLCLRFLMLADGAENCFGVSKTTARTYRLTAGGGLVQACNVSIR